MLYFGIVFGLCVREPGLLMYTYSSALLLLHFQNISIWLADGSDFKFQIRREVSVGHPISVFPVHNFVVLLFRLLSAIFQRVNAFVCDDDDFDPI